MKKQEQENMYFRVLSSKIRLWLQKMLRLFCEGLYFDVLTIFWKLSLLWVLSFLEVKEELEKIINFLRKIVLTKCILRKNRGMLQYLYVFLLKKAYSFPYHHTGVKYPGEFLCKLHQHVKSPYDQLYHFLGNYFKL